MNLASSVANCTQAQAERAVLRLGEATMTYRNLDQASARVAGLVRQFGVEPGDRVAITLPNVSEFAITYYGVLRAGGVVVPMNPLLKSREIAYYLGSGNKPNGDVADGIMAEVIFGNVAGYRDMTKADLTAIAQYIKSIPPVRNKIGK